MLTVEVMVTTTTVLFGFEVVVFFVVLVLFVVVDVIVTITYKSSVICMRDWSSVVDQVPLRAR